MPNYTTAINDNHNLGSSLPRNITLKPLTQIQCLALYGKLEQVTTTFLLYTNPNSAIFYF